MGNEPSNKKVGNIFGIVSLVIPIIMFLLILNWFFKITPYQKFEGLPLMIAPFISPFGFIFAFISVKVSSNKFGKWGIISNTILFFLPYLYWFLGTLILGP
ncbi:hypothetical protein [Clostridium sp. DJ247]|uniref:hypothetical protein n=1 Tax=Clostridium sp. DJ247 TaxID=2726188 RepID=UPI00162722E6|nr:hypothetical protein [Clostridium sp. DJ247]MBC2579703.1 hypothetical protein [Clostridium sp. DJ247]